MYIMYISTYLHIQIYFTSICGCWQLIAQWTKHLDTFDWKKVSKHSPEAQYYHQHVMPCLVSFFREYWVSTQGLASERTQAYKLITALQKTNLFHVLQIDHYVGPLVKQMKEAIAGEVFDVFFNVKITNAQVETKLERRASMVNRGSVMRKSTSSSRCSTTKKVFSFEEPKKGYVQMVDEE